MKKVIIVFATLILSVIDTMAATNNYVQKKFNTVTSYNDVYPYVLNNTKTSTNAQNISAKNTSRRSVVPRSRAMYTTTTATTATSQPRRVVQRSNTTARVATSTTPVRNISTVRNVNTRSATPVRTNTITTTSNYTIITTSTTYKVSSRSK